MARRTVVVPHKLSKEEALQRLENLPDQLKSEFAGQVSEFQARWEEDVCSFTLTARGQRVSGTMTVSGKNVEVNVNLPMLATFAWGSIETAIRQRAGRLLA